MNDALPGLTVAQSARTALAQAEVGTLACRSGPVSCRTMTVIKVTDQPDGQPCFHLDVASPVLDVLARRRLVTAVVPGLDATATLQLTGMAHPVEAAYDRLRSFRLQLLTARVCDRDGARTIPLEEYLGAEPDPLWPLARRALAHLEHAHHAELVACLRGHGYDATSVVPLELNRHGMQVAVLDEAGVQRVRLPFADGPVRSIEEVGLGLRTLLACRCGDGSHRVDLDPAGG